MLGLGLSVLDGPFPDAGAEPHGHPTGFYQNPAATEYYVSPDGTEYYHQP